MEHIMTTASNLTFNSYNETSYFANVGRAARGLMAALLAHKPAAAPVQRSKPQATLFELASRPDANMPNLMTELHFMASRG
ncbi:hypothetical protein ASD15_00395 [Massilia sp. Root351]|nr:hypothetical protein ASD15_00395 [Massilia sp. Root351]